MSDEKKPAPAHHIKESYKPNVERKSYTPSTPKEQSSYTPSTGHGSDNPPMPKKK